MACQEAQDSFVQYAPVISALEQYKKEHGDYPPLLNDLVPTYVPKITDRTNGTLTYRKLEKAFSLEFTYFGPGANRCWYGTEEMKWKCTGYF